MVGILDQAFQSVCFVKNRNGFFLDHRQIVSVGRDSILLFDTVFGLKFSFLSAENDLNNNKQAKKVIQQDKIRETIAKVAVKQQNIGKNDARKPHRPIVLKAATHNNQLASRNITRQSTGQGPSDINETLQSRPAFAVRGASGDDRPSTQTNEQNEINSQIARDFSSMAAD